MFDGDFIVQCCFALIICDHVLCFGGQSEGAMATTHGLSFEPWLQEKGTCEASSVGRVCDLMDGFILKL
jgi:hypothetical protein